MLLDEAKVAVDMTKSRTVYSYLYCKPTNLVRFIDIRNMTYWFGMSIKPLQL